jgi:hypothetical protein
MKKCDYCGRENPDQSDRCSECGTTLTESADEKSDDKPQNRPLLEWLGTSFLYAGTFIVIALLYLLSFGPVDHYCNKVVTNTSTTNAYSVVRRVTVRYHPWVGMIYRPAIYLRMRSELYERYIALWHRGDELN